MNRRTVVSGLALTVAAAGAALWWPRTPASPPFLAAEAQSGGEVDTSKVMEMTLGNPDAKVEVVEYASFTCPHCRNFHANVYPQLKANYIDTGKIHFIYREVYFDIFGLKAAMLARCGDGQRYFGISGLLYDKQDEWLASREPAGIMEALRTLGKVAGMGADQVDACMNDPEMEKALVTVYQQNAERDGINSTPSFLIDGQKYSNMSYADFSKILDEKLAG